MQRDNEGTVIPFPRPDAASKKTVKRVPIKDRGLKALISGNPQIAYVHFLRVITDNMLGSLPQEEVEKILLSEYQYARDKGKT